MRLEESGCKDTGVVGGVWGVVREVRHDNDMEHREVVD